MCVPACWVVCIVCSVVRLCLYVRARTGACCVPQVRSCPCPSVFLCLCVCLLYVCVCCVCVCVWCVCVVCVCVWCVCVVCVCVVMWCVCVVCAVCAVCVVCGVCVWSVWSCVCVRTFLVHARWAHYPFYFFKQGDCLICSSGSPTKRLRR